ncbi:hypothetical protein GCM10027569_09640 [Flindersiella endophytica]
MANEVGRTFADLVQLWHIGIGMYVFGLHVPQWDVGPGLGRTCCWDADVWGGLPLGPKVAFDDDCLRTPG